MNLARKIAQQTGQYYYMTDTPCLAGHLAKRRTSNGTCIECDRLRQKKNAPYFKEYYARHRAKKRNATPPWVDIDTLRLVYNRCPEGFHVDHIVPLNGRDVCGLHVPWNLQYLPANANLLKSNKLLDDGLPLSSAMH